jgi:hypothetical protein
MAQIISNIDSSGSVCYFSKRSASSAGGEWEAAAMELVPAGRKITIAEQIHVRKYPVA